MSLTQSHCPEFQTATPVPQIWYVSCTCTCAARAVARGPVHGLLLYSLVVKSKVADGRLIVVTWEQRRIAHSSRALS
jgi:hypothetical protein